MSSPSSTPSSGMRGGCAVRRALPSTSRKGKSSARWQFGSDSFALRIGETRPIVRTSVTGRALLEGQTIHISDVRDPSTLEEYPDFRYPPGICACLVTPLLRDGRPAVGALFVFRSEDGPFTEAH